MTNPIFVVLVVIISASAVFAAGWAIGYERGRRLQEKLSQDEMLTIPQQILDKTKPNG